MTPQPQQHVHKCPKCGEYDQVQHGTDRHGEIGFWCGRCDYWFYEKERAP